MLILIELVVISVLSFLIIRDLVIRLRIGRRRGEFVCLRCGKCCTLKVEPTSEEIRKMEERGFRREEFMEGRFIKRVNGACIFLKKENGFYKCGIYDFRPEVCRAWPFSAFMGGRFVMARMFSCPGLARIEK